MTENSTTKQSKDWSL